MALAAGAQRYVCTRCGVSRLARTVVALLAVLLVSCAAPSGRTYRDGAPVERAPVFVTPGYAPAGAGLPEYMPAMERETVPRGRDRRVLPPTREPGIWASDSGPKAVSDHSPARLFDTVLPFPPNADDDTRAMVQICADQMSYSAIRAGFQVDHGKGCRAARLYLHCANAVKANYDKKKANGETLDLEFAARAIAVQKEAMAMVKRECGDAANAPDGVVNEVAKTWDMITKGQPSYDVD